MVFCHRDQVITPSSQLSSTTFEISPNTSYNFSYFYIIVVIFEQIYLTRRWSPKSGTESLELWQRRRKSTLSRAPEVVWFGLVLWHINHWRLFNAKSIFIHINSTISNHFFFFCISTGFVYTQLNVKTVLFQKIQFCISTV